MFFTIKDYFCIFLSMNRNRKSINHINDLIERKTELVYIYFCKKG